MACGFVIAATFSTYNVGGIKDVAAQWRQTAGWIKMVLGVEWALVQQATAPLPKKGAEPPIFGLCLLWPNGWMDQDVTWYGGRPRP